jgi:hypothetical protein
MTQRFKCLHIDAGAHTITATDYADFRDLQRMVGGNLTIATDLPSGDVLFVNDEGLLQPCEAFFRIEGYEQPLAGDGVLVGPDKWDPKVGDQVSSDVVTTVEQLTPLIRFLSSEQVRAWARAHASEPSASISFFNDRGELETEILSTHGQTFGVEPGTKREGAGVHRGLPVSIYRTLDFADASNGGVSALVDRAIVVGPGIDPVCEAGPGDVVLELKPGNVRGTVKLVPQGVTRWTMFGGNFAYTTDSRLRDAVCALTGSLDYGALPIHDRIEG